MMTRIFLVITALSSSTLCVAQVPDNSGEGALARLRTLAGEWEGTFTWTGARKDTGAMNATYYLTGNNSAVVENLTMAGVPTMTSVYHLNGAELRMTHYCGAIESKFFDTCARGGTSRLSVIGVPALPLVHCRLTTLGSSLSISKQSQKYPSFESVRPDAI